MKTNLLTAIFVMFGLTNIEAKEEKTKADSLIIQFGNNTRMVIHAKDKKGIQQLKNYDLNKIVRDMGMSLDSTTRETYIIIAGQNGKKYLKDTVLTLRTGGGNVGVTVNESNGYETKVSIKDGGLYVKDGNEKVYVGTRGIHVEDGSENVHIGGSSPFEDSTRSEKRHRTSIDKSPRNGFNIDFGLSAYTQNTAGKYNTDDYDLNTWGSRYISLGWTRGGLLSKGKNASLFIDLGLDFSWYNLMYQGNNTVKKTNSTIAFPTYTIDNQPRDLSKSKLTANYLNISLMPTIAFKNSALNYLSFGVYGGYRLDSYTKTKEASGGKKERLRDNFYLNDFRYGLSLEVGWRNFPDFFVHYDNSELFQSGKGPAVKMITFGVKL